MANVLLTEVCIRSCPYCFAKQYMSDISESDYLSWDNLIYITDFLIASGEKHISLLGGEPLLHPHIAEFIKYLSKRGLHITIFTSGVMPDLLFNEFATKILNSKQELQLSFVCNVNEPRFSPKSEIEKVKKFFSTFGDRCSLSFNIYRLDFSMFFLMDYIIKFGLRRHVRLGLAHPIPGAKNLFINPSDFIKVKESLIPVFQQMAELNIEAGFDCGFPMCMFSDDELGKIFKFMHGQVSFQCGPAIDIGTDLSCWSCFPLSNYNKKSVLEFSSYREMHEFYYSKMHEVRQEIKGIYNECDSCSYNRNNLCSGGCLAHILNNHIKEDNLR